MLSEMPWYVYAVLGLASGVLVWAVLCAFAREEKRKG